MEPPKTPELDKVKGLRPERNILAEFADYLESKQMVICGIAGGEYIPVPYSMEKLISKSLGIDDRKVAEEQDALLAYQRHLNEKCK